MGGIQFVGRAQSPEIRDEFVNRRDVGFGPENVADDEVTGDVAALVGCALPAVRTLPESDAGVAW